MTTWFTADLHFGHANIINLCDRPFATADEMDATLTGLWNETVAPGDTVWVLGDVALSTKKLGPVKDLNGHKILVAGNHDACWTAHKRWSRAKDAYFDAGFDEIEPNGIVRMLALAGGQVVDLAHLPYAGDSHPQDRYAGRRPEDQGRVLLCGHVHKAWQTRGRMVNVGVDVWDYRPVAEETLRDLIVAQVLTATGGLRP